MPAPFSLTAVYEEVENGWVQARLKELPGVITAAPTRAEAREDLLDALSEYLRSVADDDGIAAEAQVEELSFSIA